MTTKKPQLEKLQDSADPKKARTKAATLANMRRREERAAALLIERGWTVVSPYEKSGSPAPEQG